MLDYIIFLPLIFLPFVNHCIEVTFDFALEINSDLIDVAKFDKGPSSIGLEISVVRRWGRRTYCDSKRSASSRNRLVNSLNTGWQKLFMDGLKAFVETEG